MGSAGVQMQEAGCEAGHPQAGSDNGVQGRVSSEPIIRWLAGSDNGVQGRVSSEPMIRWLASPGSRHPEQNDGENVLVQISISRGGAPNFATPRGAILSRAHGFRGRDQSAGMPRERFRRHSCHLQCILLTRSAKDRRSRSAHARSTPACSACRSFPRKVRTIVGGSCVVVTFSFCRLTQSLMRCCAVTVVYWSLCPCAGSPYTLN